MFDAVQILSNTIEYDQTKSPNRRMSSNYVFCGIDQFVLVRHRTSNGGNWFGCLCPGVDKSIACERRRISGCRLCRRLNQKPDSFLWPQRCVRVLGLTVFLLCSTILPLRKRELMMKTNNQEAPGHQEEINGQEDSQKCRFSSGLIN